MAGFPRKHYPEFISSFLSSCLRKCNPAFTENYMELLIGPQTTSHHMRQVPNCATQSTLTD
jgi:hypothetical protein